MIVVSKIDANSKLTNIIGGRTGLPSDICIKKTSCITTQCKSSQAWCQMLIKIMSYGEPCWTKVLFTV